jgi:hypothetical protein
MGTATTTTATLAATPSPSFVKQSKSLPNLAELQHRIANDDFSDVDSAYHDTQSERDCGEEPSIDAAAHAPSEQEELEEAPLFVLLTTYFGLIVLTLFGHLREFFGRRFCPSDYAHLKENNVRSSFVYRLNSASQGYAPLTSDYESFYTRHIFRRVRDCMSRPITGVPGRTLTLLDRESTDYYKTFRCALYHTVDCSLSWQHDGRTA